MALPITLSSKLCIYFNPSALTPIEPSAKCVSTKRHAGLTGTVSPPRKAEKINYANWNFQQLVAHVECLVPIGQSLRAGNSHMISVSPKQNEVDKCCCEMYSSLAAVALQLRMCHKKFAQSFIGILVVIIAGTINVFENSIFHFFRG